MVEEVIIVDAYSTDDTVKIATSLGAKVVQKDWEGYSQNKNFGNRLVKNDWILSIDADEVLSDELIQRIQELTFEKKTVYSFNRLNNYCGKWVRYSGWHPDWNVRLFPKSILWKGDFVHEELDLPTDCKVIQIKGLLYHYSYQNSTDHWQRIEKYATLSAQQLFQEDKKATFAKLWFAPIARFFSTFFLKLGFLDGKVGWIISSRNIYLVRRKYQLLKEMQTKS